MSEKIRDSFIFYRSFYQSAKKLPKEDKAELFDAICSYALDGELIDLSVVPEAIFTVIQPNLDANRRRWENGCKEKVKTKDKQKISKAEAKDKQSVSKAEGNKDKDKDKDVNVDKNVKLELEYQFESFWKLYNPIHTGKGSKQDAKKTFLKVIKKTPFVEIENGLKAYMTDCHSKGTYTKQVSVWLNKESWKDEYQVGAAPVTQDSFCQSINELAKCTKLIKEVIIKGNTTVVMLDGGIGCDNWKKLTDELKNEIKGKIKQKFNSEIQFKY